MKPLTIDSFKTNNIRAVSSDQKSVDNLSYTSVKFEYNGDKISPLRIDGSFRISKFENSKGTIYSLLVDENFEGSCILKLYQAYVGSAKPISLSVEEILVTERETSSSYFNDEEN